MSDRIKVFLSYAREDQSYAIKLFEELKNRNIDVWFDKESLLPGQKWEIEIRKAIHASRYFIAILSSKSVTKRGIVQKEIKEALDVVDEFPENEIFIVPIRIDSCEPSNEKLRKIQWVDMFPNWEEGLEKILKAINLDKKQYNGHIFTDVEEEISALLIEARSCIDKKSSMKALNQAKDICKKIMKENNPIGYKLMVETLSELANESDLPSKRHKLWSDCLSEAFHGIDKFDDISFVDALASKTVDFVQDTYVTIPIAEANKLYASVKDKIDYFLKKNLPTHEISHLFARKSALIRNVTKFHATRRTQEAMSQKALRCAEKAVNENPDSWYAHLELASSFWHIAQFDKGDEQYYNKIRSAENHFWKSISIKPTVYNLLSICRFFRFTYQTDPFLECFNRYLKREYNKRRLLQGAYVYGEVVMQLWYSQYPSEILEYYIEDAGRLLEESIDAGYSDARHIIDLAFVKAAKGEINVGKDVLKTLHKLSVDTSWTKIAEIVSKVGTSDDLITQGFALGIADSSVWNKLGTFIKDFLGDSSLAITMYKEALRLNPSNAVAMTNLAQALLDIDTLQSIQDAERWISKAASCADRRFRWWRNVREQIRGKMPTHLVRTPLEQNIGKRMSFKHLSDILHSYRALKKVKDSQYRGYQFEKLVHRLITVSLGNCFASYRSSLEWTDRPVVQIDAAFSFFDKDFYRVEAKWTSDPVTPTDIVLFREKLDTAGVKGLFISISGFTTEAIKKAYEFRKEYQILLMDGEELEFVLQGSPPLDEAIRLKQIYFGKDSNPYFRIKPIKQI